MDIDSNLVQRAQLLLTLDHPLTQIKDILLDEGYPREQVLELIDATEEVLDYIVPPEYSESKIGINILHAEDNEDSRRPAIDILIDKFSGKISLVTPQYQETWRVASEVRKAIRQQRDPVKYYH